ncbi:Probable phospholipid-transporting ATPase VA [Strongyloides ratti]|uniref:Phospholipid-transporting ATPase n=1 Tax=Strongyloides ratti TaxID=34506 RepID=A0A090KWD6_STRRB|nr:Probable phospholipid-transporting ATPase VA [Strongyloides ratti]CEF60171.1 Probable phospholipid-transporting ATPase VA [Strongyloides ratti]
MSNEDVISITPSTKWVPKNPPIIHTFLNICSGIKKIFFPDSIVYDKSQREIIPNYLYADTPRYDLINNKKYNSNKISTTKYPSLILFPIQNFLLQLKVYANIYFLFVATLNTIPFLEAYSGWKAFLPIGIIMIFKSIKDFFEDYRRRKNDKNINKSLVYVFDASKKRFRKMDWENVLVGDFVHLSINETIPADILLMRCSDIDGTVYVETSNLDGESNLKEKKVLKSCIEYCCETEQEFNPTFLNLSIFCSQPDKDFDKFNGKVIYSQNKYDIINKDNIIYRGCQIKNTTFIEGIVLYTGKDTKALLNNGYVRHKTSSLDKSTNKYTLICIGLLFLICTFETIFSIIFQSVYSRKQQPGLDIPFVLEYNRTIIIKIILTIFGFILDYQTLVPLSLYISIEFIKVALSYFMTRDINLYHEESDKTIEVKTLNIPEELGQIKFILSDKTGTLTENKMVFRGCHINGIDYSKDCEQIYINPLDKDTEVYRSKKLIKELSEGIHDENSSVYHFIINMAICNTVVVTKKREDTIERGFVQGNTLQVANAVFYDHTGDTNSRRNDDVIVELSSTTQSSEDQETSSISSFSDKIRTSIRIFSRKVSKNIKHNRKKLRYVIKGILENDSKNKMIINRKDDVYESESPDELCLVKGAKVLGFTMLKRHHNSIDLSINGYGYLNINITKILKFDSNRKRMSVISIQKGKIYIYSKGADDAIMNNLDKSFSSSEYGKKIIKSSKKALKEFSSSGRRTLCLAYRIITFDELNKFIDTIDNIEYNNDINHEEQLNLAYNELEKDFILLGVVSIEDRLQDGVPETIISLRKAGIHIWVLTGDKYETALNVARSCSLFDVNTKQVKINCLEDLEKIPMRIPYQYNAVLSSSGVKLLKDNDENVIRILKNASSVLCYRMTPNDKAIVAQTVIKEFKSKVLAIGDGANDVPMIISANIGVGLGGQEGMQAVMSADYSLGRFKFLQTLLLIHGHWCYYRITESLLYLFYKNFVYCFTLFWYNFYNGVSTMCPYDPYYSMLYPIIFSGLQPLMYGILDQNYSPKQLFNNPELYKTNLENDLYSVRLFILNILDALWQSLAIFFCTYLAYNDTTIDMWSFGYCLLTSIFMVNTLHLCLLTKNWTWILFFCNVIFFFVHVLYFVLYTIFISASMGITDTPVYVGVYNTISFVFWAVVLLSTIIALIPRFYIKLIVKRYPVLLLTDKDIKNIRTRLSKFFAQFKR